MNAKIRIRSMLKLDFYRLFHTPVFYIILVVSAIIPAMLLTMTGVSGPDGAGSGVEFTSAWQLVESTGGSAVAANPMDFGGYANINMVFIFAGLLMAIFVAHDYSSGFVKNIFTVHARKIDYVIGKSAVGVFGGVCMIFAYIFGAVISGLIMGKSFEVAVGGLILCILAKTFLMCVFCALFLAVAVFFKNRLWLTIIFTFLFGMVLYPAASVATLGTTVVVALIMLLVGAAGTAAIGLLSTFILDRRDLA